MTTNPSDHPVLLRFRSAVTDIYGDRLERVVLFGSRARGDARADLYYDIAIFLSHMPDRLAEIYRLADLSTAILDDSGEIIHGTPHRAGAYNERTPLMHEIRAEGLDL